MAHTSTAWGDVVTAIVAGMRAVPGYRSPWDKGATGIPVYDSSEWGLSSDLDPTVLVIGHVGDPEQPTEAGQAPQRVAVLGTQHHRSEDGTVSCWISATSGDFAAGAVPVVRDAALSVLDAVDTYLRAHGDLGLVSGGAYQHVLAKLDGLPSIRPAATQDGPEFEVDFTVGYTARI